MFHAKLVTKEQLPDDAAWMVGPIAEGETPEQAVERMERTFGHVASEYAYVLYDEPSREEYQQFPVVIGSVWASYEVKEGK